MTARLRAVLWICVLTAVSAAQDTGTELRPEYDVYVQLQPMIRIQFRGPFIGDLTTGLWRVASPSRPRMEVASW